MKPWEHSIIIVDDEPDEVLLLKRAFQKADVKNPLQVFRDGQEVIDYLGKLETDARTALFEASPVLMLLDLKMPRKSGFEVLEWLRRRPRLKNLVVIVMANSVHLSDINRAYGLGCNSYLPKPENFEQLVEMVSLIQRYWLLLNLNPDLQYTANPFSYLER
jgi:CheY-like chemotaxis protein